MTETKLKKVRAALHGIERAACAGHNGTCKQESLVHILALVRAAIAEMESKP